MERRSPPLPLSPYLLWLLFLSPSFIQLTLAEFTAALERFGQLDNEEEQYKCKFAGVSLQYKYDGYTVWITNTPNALFHDCCLYFNARS